MQKEIHDDRSVLCRLNSLIKRTLLICESFFHGEKETIFK